MSFAEHLILGYGHISQGESMIDSVLVKALLEEPEAEWIEYKHNNSDPQDIGEYISAIANSAALHEKQEGYIIWGIEDVTRNVIGTTFRPKSQKINGQEIENWLLTQLRPAAEFQITELQFAGLPVVVFRILPARQSPIRFKECEFIRIGSYKKKLRDFPEKERALWARFSQVSFEKSIAKSDIESGDVLELIDYPTYFQRVGQPLPDNKAGILKQLTAEGFITPRTSGNFDITNFGAILFARDLSKFDHLGRKGLRVIIYKGKDRIETVKELTGKRGYAAGFSAAIRYIDDQLPRNEQVREALREDVPMYPAIAVRELVANAVIHQDFHISGTGPMVEIFADRIEVTNPGTPLVETLRLLDGPPRSRNEDLAAFMRRINVCEERGSGIDKVVFQAELFQLPAPEFVVTENHMRAVLFSYKTLNQMDKSDRIRACYLHASLRRVSNESMTNSSLRGRFGIEEKNYSIASRIIAETIGANLIRLADPTSKSKKHAKYLPFWA